jgi:hypothetical protein
VSLFLRRIGFKKYVELFKNYNVDGKTLILLDEEDYENLNITNRVHIRKIRVEIDRIYKRTGPALQISEDHAVRREKIRRQKMFNAAAIMAQKHFRIFSARRRVGLIREIRRIQMEEEAQRLRINNSNIWYADSPALPSLDPEIAAGWTMKDGVRLPPIKTFGRSRDFLSHRGWGRKGNSLQREWAPTAAATHKNFDGDFHATKVYVDKLHINGYDEKRMELFKRKQPGYM